MFHDLVVKTRSYRRFVESEPITLETMQELVDLARLAASGANMQPLKFMVSCEPDRNAAIFPLLAWAGYLEDWPGPGEGERPAGYIIVLGDTTVRKGPFDCDCGIAAQNIVLGATEKGLGACMIGSIKREKLRETLSIPEHFEIILVIALGKPAETVELEAVGADGDIKYWRDEDGVHHVPKRSLDDILLD